MSAKRKTGLGRWRGWDRQGDAPVTIRHVEPTVQAEPMTEAQAKLLKRLCTAQGETFNPKWTKRMASKRINQLQRRGR